MQNALATSSDQSSPQRAEGPLVLNVVVSDVLEDQQQNSVIARKEKGRVKDRAIPVAPVKIKVTGNEENANTGRRKARAQEAENVRFKHEDQSRGKGKKETSDCGRPVQRQDSLVRCQKSGTGQAQARQEKRVDRLASVTREEAFQKTSIVTAGILRSASFTKEDNAEQSRNVPSSTSATFDRPSSPTRQQKIEQKKIRT